MTDTEKILKTATDAVMKWAKDDARELVEKIIENTFLYGKIEGKQEICERL